MSRGGVRTKLPPSKKTRALLAYLLLTGREHRRARLCSMFWDVADDPRGALRWSLSKLRALLGDDGAARIVADRESVRIEVTHARVDVLDLRAALAGTAALDGLSTQELERWAGAFAGELMEGLDLPDFDDYQAWCVAEREQMRALRARILGALCGRLAATPSRALPHARAWAQVDPLGLDARTTLLRLALASGAPDEAAQHFESARRMFEELGPRKLGDLKLAWHALSTGVEAGVETVGAAGAEASAAVVGAAVAQPGPSPRRPRAREAVDPNTPLLVGREDDLAHLVDGLDQVRSGGRERVALVLGEPGIGKTRLLDELANLAHRSGATVMRGVAYEGESGRPYGPLIDSIRGLDGGDESSLRDELSPLLPELGGGAGGESTRDRLFSAVADFIAARARQAPPVLLIVDDVQWLDPATAQLLHYVARTARELPLMLVLAARSEELPDNDGFARVLRSLRRDRVLTELALQPLGPAALSSLLATHGGELDAEVLARQSGGNPLFALELLRMGAREDDALPETVGDVVRERVERLSPEASDVLRWCAVLGDGFGIERLEPLIALDLEALVTALEELELGSLLRRGTETDGRERYRFAHELVRRAVYADLSGPRQRLMHRRVAAALKESDEVSEGMVAELAHHATLGEAHDMAAQACAAAGLRCQRLFANDQALMLARRGLRHAEQLAGIVQVKRRIDLLEVQLLASRPEDMDATAAELRALAERALHEGAPGSARRAFYLLSFVNWEGGAWAEAKRDVMQFEALGRGGGENEQVASMAHAARCLILLERDMGEAGAMLMEAEARARPLGLEPPSMVDARGMLCLHRAEIADAMALFERARVLASASGDRLLEFHALEHQVMAELDRRGYARASVLAQRLAELGERLREGSEAPLARAMGAISRYGAGEDCLQDIEDALQELRMVDAKYRLAYALLYAALIDLDRGDSTRALERASEAWPIAELLERPTETLLSLVLQTRAARDLGDAETCDRLGAAIEGGSWHGASVMAHGHHERLLGKGTG